MTPLLLTKHDIWLHDSTISRLAVSDYTASQHRERMRVFPIEPFRLTKNCWHHYPYQFLCWRKSQDIEVSCAAQDKFTNLLSNRFKNNRMRFIFSFEHCKYKCLWLNTFKVPDWNHKWLGSEVIISTKPWRNMYVWICNIFINHHKFDRGKYVRICKICITPTDHQILSTTVGNPSSIGSRRPTICGETSCHCHVAIPTVPLLSMLNGTNTYKVMQSHRNLGRWK